MKNKFGIKNKKQNQEEEAKKKQNKNKKNPQSFWYIGWVVQNRGTPNEDKHINPIWLATSVQGYNVSIESIIFGKKIENFRVCFLSLGK